MPERSLTEAPRSRKNACRGLTTERTDQPTTCPFGPSTLELPKRMRTGPFQPVGAWDESDGMNGQRSRLSESGWPPPVAIHSYWPNGQGGVHESNRNLPTRVCHRALAVMATYSVVYQNVQSSVGSTTIML
jgi:hypothetical protein